MGDTSKVAATFLLAVALIALGLPAVPTVVLLICAALLLNGVERAASKRDLWPD